MGVEIQYHWELDYRIRSALQTLLLFFGLYEKRRQVVVRNTETVIRFEVVLTK